MRRRNLPASWRGRDASIVAHIEPDDPFAGVTEPDRPPEHARQNGLERLARFVEGQHLASAPVAALANGIGRRREQNALESHRNGASPADGPEAGENHARTARVNDGPRVPNLAHALEAAIAAEPDHWDSRSLHVSDTRHALIGEGCPRQL